MTTSITTDKKKDAKSLSSLFPSFPPPRRQRIFSNRSLSLLWSYCFVLLLVLNVMPVQPFTINHKIHSSSLIPPQRHSSTFHRITTTPSKSSSSSSQFQLTAAASDDLNGDSSSSPLNTATNTANNNDNPDESSLIRPLKVAFVTGNKMKTREINAILADHAASHTDDHNHNNNIDDPFQYVVDLRVVQVDLPEIQEVDTLAIAKHKAQLASQLVGGGPCVIEDTALQFTALGGMPGPYIKWFQESLQCEGLYKILQGYEDKSATAVCTLAFCPSPHADPILFTGEIHGTIVAPVPGRGFGWDGIFVPEGEELPFSCMTTEQKNAKSHRGKAVRQWAEWMQRNRQELWQRQEDYSNGGKGRRSMIGHKGMDFTIYSPEQ